MSEYLRWVETECPYCNHTNKLRLNVAQYHSHIVTCDVDDGGCDKEYAVKIRLHVATEVYALAKVGVK